MAKRILLADDSITIQKVVELTFSDGDYEVTAVNNGAKAIAKLAEMRPDVILSDIIMPEKNGYEVCEYVKSHPEYRNIPVILLTGTFEPFDPDRADKAGCDAVVTKPFESQSLIHKVEELVQASKSTATTAPQPAVGGEQLTTGVFTPSMESEGAEHDSDIFGAAAPAAAAAMDMPFASEPAPAAPAPAPSGVEGSPWDEPAETGGETRAFSTMSFEELQRLANETPAAAAPPPPPAPEPEPVIEPSPWDEPAAPAPGGGETRAFPMMSFDDLQRIPRETPPEPAPSAPEASPWDEAPAAGGETRAFPSMSFEDLQRMANETPHEQAPAAQPFDAMPAPTPAAPEPASPWDEPAEEFGGETRAFGKLSFEELEQMANAGATPASAPVDDPQPDPQLFEPQPEPEPLAQMEAPVEPELSAPLMFEPEREPEPIPAAAPEPEPAAEPATAAPSAASFSGDLTDEQIDRIARRVVQLMSDHVVRNIAWEVIPDMAEMVVKERIRQLEAE